MPFSLADRIQLAFFLFMIKITSETRITLKSFITFLYLGISICKVILHWTLALWGFRGLKDLEQYCQQYHQKDCSEAELVFQLMPTEPLGLLSIDLKTFVRLFQASKRTTCTTSSPTSSRPRTSGSMSAPATSSGPPSYRQPRPWCASVDLSGKYPWNRILYSKGWTAFD